MDGYIGVECTFGIDLVTRCVNTITRGKNAYIYFMSNDAYEQYMETKNQMGPLHEGSNQVLYDCFNEFKRLIDFCTVEHDYIPTCDYNIFDCTHTIKLRSMKFNHVIAINFPLHSSVTQAWKYLAEKTYKEYRYEEIEKFYSKETKSLLDERGHKIYIIDRIPY